MRTIVPIFAVTISLLSLFSVVYMAYDVTFGATAQKNIEEYHEIKNYCEPFSEKTFADLPIKCRQYFHI